MRVLYVLMHARALTCAGARAGDHFTAQWPSLPHRMRMCGCRVAPEHVGPINRTVAHAPGRPPASVWANGTSSSSQASSCRLLGRIRIIGTFLITRACGVTTATPRLVPRSSHSRRTSRNTHARARLSATPALLRWSARFRSVMLRRAPHVVPFVVHVGRGGCRASSTLSRILDFAGLSDFSAPRNSYNRLAAPQCLSPLPPAARRHRPRSSAGL